MLLIVSKYLIPKGYRGLTVFPFVFVSQQSDKDEVVLMYHERIHLRQQMELLVLPFFVWYAIEFLLKWVWYRDRKKAYRNIVFEREAYENEKAIDYLKSRSVWRFFKYY
jgi:hypothetical protein